jgi:hypothetical protein
MIRNKLEAQFVINAAIQSHARTWEMAKQTESYVINNDPPFDDTQLKEKGIDWQSNWNYGKGKGRAEQIITKNVQEVTKAVSLLDINFENFDKKKHKDPVYEFLTIPEMRADFAERIGAAFSETVIEKPQNIDTIIGRGEYESFLFGYASCIHDQTSIFPSILSYLDIAFEDHTDVDNIGKFVVFDVIKGEDLYAIYKRIRTVESDSEAIEQAEEEGRGYGEDCPTFTDSGWNENALLLVICQNFNIRDDCLSCLNGDMKKPQDGKWTKTFTTWEDIEILASKRGEYWCQLNMNNIYLAKIFELIDGTIYENYCALECSVSTERTYVASIRADILYHKKRENVKQDELINLIKDINVEGSVYIHDIKGNGKFVAESALRYDIFRNTLNDKFTLSGLPWVHDPSGGLIEKNTQVKVFGGMVVVGQNMEIVPNQIRVDLAPHIQALSIEEQEYQSNMQHVQPNTKLSNRPTKDEVNFINAESNATRMSDIPKKLKNYTSILTRVFKSLDDDLELMERDKLIRKDFYSALTQEFSDMSLELPDLKKILKVVNLVQVSPVMSDREAIQAALSVASTASSRKRLTRMFLSTFNFSRRQIRDIMETEDYGHDAELASIENNMFQDTREVVFGLGQDHIIHLQAHFFKADQLFAGLQQGEDAVRAHRYVTNILTNTALHVNAIANSVFHQDKAKDYMKIQKFLEQKLKQLAVQLDAQLKAAQEAGQEQGGQGGMQLPPELQHKFYLDRIKLMEKLKTSQQRTQAAHEFKVASFQLDQELKKQKTQADIDNKTKKTQVDVESSLAKKSVEMLAR